MPKPFDLPQTDPTKAYGALATNHNLENPKVICIVVYISPRNEPAV